MRRCRRRRQCNNHRVKLPPQSRVSNRAQAGGAPPRLEIQSKPIGMRQREGSRGQRLPEELLELIVHYKGSSARLVAPLKRNGVTCFVNNRGNCLICCVENKLVFVE